MMKKYILTEKTGAQRESMVSALWLSVTNYQLECVKIQIKNKYITISITKFLTFGQNIMPRVVNTIKIINNSGWLHQWLDLHNKIIHIK